MIGQRRVTMQWHRQCLAFSHSEGGQRLFSFAHCHRDAACHAGNACQCRVDFAKLYAVSTDLDLRIAPPQKDQRAVGPVAPPIARAIPAFSLTRYELRRAAFRIKVIAFGHADSPDP